MHEFKTGKNKVNYHQNAKVLFINLKRVIAVHFNDKLHKHEIDEPVGSRVLRYVRFVMRRARLPVLASVGSLRVPRRETSTPLLEIC
jgi:hypothetical protein